MQIYGPYRVSTAQPTSPAAPTRQSTPTSGDRSTAAPADQLDLSSAASEASASGEVNRLAASEAVAGGGEIRIDRVADLRRQIASGNYETPEKLDAALDRMLEAWG